MFPLCGLSLQRCNIFLPAKFPKCVYKSRVIFHYVSIKIFQRKEKGYINFITEFIHDVVEFLHDSVYFKDVVAEFTYDE